MRPPGELETIKSTQYSSTSWVPDYTYLVSPIEHKWGDMYPPYLKCTRQLLQAEKDGEYKDMTYEDAHNEMQAFLEENNFELNSGFKDKFSFFINQMAKSNAQLAYDAIFADMNAIDKIHPSLYKDPLILEMVMMWPHILTYIKKNTPEQTELKKQIQEMKDAESKGKVVGGKNIKKRYAKNTKGRRRQISRKR
jgi:hypothetical protein